MLLGFKLLCHVGSETPCVLQASVQDDEDLGRAGEGRDILKEALNDQTHSHGRGYLNRDTPAEDFHDI